MGCILFYILPFFCGKDLERDDCCIGGFSLAGPNRYCNPTTALLSYPPGLKLCRAEGRAAAGAKRGKDERSCGWPYEFHVGARIVAASFHCNLCKVRLQLILVLTNCLCNQGYVRQCKVLIMDAAVWYVEPLAWLLQPIFCILERTFTTLRLIAKRWTNSL